MNYNQSNLINQSNDSGMAPQMSFYLPYTILVFVGVVMGVLGKAVVNFLGLQVSLISSI